MRLRRTELALFGLLGGAFVVLASMGLLVLRAINAPLPTPHPLANIVIPEPTTQEPTFTPSQTLTPSLTSTLTPTSTATLSATPSFTPTITATPSLTSSPTITRSPTRTATKDLSTWNSQNLGPYLQSLSTDSVVIAWETSDSSQGEILYGETEAYGLSVLDPNTGNRHFVTLTGLSPFTLYHYRVMRNGEPFSQDFTFRTAASSEQTTFSFVVYGDTQKNPSIHQAVVNRAASLDPDLALHLGDLVNSGAIATLWVEFMNIEGNFLAEVPLFPTIGSHDMGSDLFFDLFYLPGTERWYAFNFGNAHFICLQVDGFTDFGEGSDQYTWLESTLSSNTLPWTFVYFHKSPYTSEYEGPNELAIRYSLTPLFEQYGVDIVFNGHNHNYQRSQANGVTYIASGGGGGELSYSIEPDEYLIFSRTTHHLVHISIDGDTLSSVAVTSSGEQFDPFTSNPR